MAKKSRYTAYLKAMTKAKKPKPNSTKESVLKRLKEMQDREFIMTVPIEDKGNA